MILAMCLFPFIPKQSTRLIAIKKKGAIAVFAHDFENRICLLREMASSEGEGWIAEKKTGGVVFVKEEKIGFEDFSIQANAKTTVKLLNIYDKKLENKKIYRFKIDIIYQSKHLGFKKKFTSYVSLES